MANNGGVLALTLTACSTSAGPKPHLSSLEPDSSLRPATSLQPTTSLAPSTVDNFFGGGLQRQDFGSFGLDRTENVPSDDGRFATALRVRYPADSASQLSAANSDTSDGGAQVYLARRGGPVDEAYLRYYVRFPADFDFVRGGKLPGLYGGRTNNGRKIPDGTNGFSTRYMWRAKGAGEVYAYLPSSVAHGTSLGRGSWTWPTGTWATVEQHVRLNTPGQADGQVQVWLNGALVFEQTGLTFRSTWTLRIEGLFFSTFFGGGDAPGPRRVTSTPTSPGSSYPRRRVSP
jgi:hypothetical protein